MKTNLRKRIVMSLAAMMISAVHIYAETLPPAVIAAEGRKMPSILCPAVCGSSPFGLKLPDVPGSSVYDIPDDEKSFRMLLKTNGLYDLTLTPNLGLEIELGKGWTIGGNVMYGWWTDRSRFYWRAFATDIDVRKYFGENLSGHHLGLYAGLMTYDFELGGRGFICDWRDRWGKYAGIDYGYSLPVAKNLNIDFTLGLGYAGGRYKEYLPDFSGFDNKWHYVWQSTGNLHYFGPTRLEISIVWMLDLAGKRK